MNNELKNIEKQQLNNYIQVVLEIINNNTKSLMEDDIASLVKKPPLESMDVINNNILSVAKSFDIMVDNSKCEKIIDNYRKRLLKDLEYIGRVRENTLSNIVSEFKPVKDVDIIKLPKKDFNQINKDINKYIKKVITDDVLDYILNNIDSIFIGLNKNEKKDKIVLKCEKYFKKTYIKQLIENINMKILVKDTTLINGVKEQGERYIFTKKNSRINDL